MDLSCAWPVTTERLRLRPLIGGDAEALLAYRSRPEVCLYVPFEPMTARQIAAKLDGPWSPTREQGGAPVGIARRDDDRVIGDLSLFDASDEHRTAEIGWILDPAHGGRGYATEAVHALLHVAFELCGLHRVIARVDARNAPSLALARRLELRQEAHLVANEWFKGVWSDEIDFALLAHEWAQQHAGGARSCRWPVTMPQPPGSGHDGAPSVGTRSAIESTVCEGRKG